jgi:hypothetical protein
MTEFLPNDPAQALVEVKEKLYNRLAILRAFISDMEIDEYGPHDSTERAYMNEWSFLEDLLDIIERS